MLLYSAKNGKLFVVEDATAVTSGKLVAWFIGQGKVKRLADVGGNLTKTGANQFVACRSAYAPAHSWKNYCFHWDGGKIVEYGGKKMSITHLKRARNGVRVIKAIRCKLGAITTIYYRSNGIINVNYKDSTGHGSRYDNVTLKYRSGTVTYAKVNA